MMLTMRWQWSCFVLVHTAFKLIIVVCLFFFFNDTATTEIYTLSLHDALPILQRGDGIGLDGQLRRVCQLDEARSEEHTSELQSQSNLVCRLLLEKKKTR